MGLWVILGTIGATLFVVLLVLNFRKPEKEPHHKVKHLYGIKDAQLRREMGTLLGPAIVPGNQITALMNGEGNISRDAKGYRVGPTITSPSKPTFIGRDRSVSNSHKH